MQIQKQTIKPLVCALLLFSVFSAFGGSLAANTKNIVQEQFQKAPEDPSFSYDTRYVPGVKKNEAYLSKELEKEVIVETIDSNRETGKEKGLNLNLPNLPQAVVIIVIVILFALYRMRIRSNSQYRKR